ncbi:MAG: DUF4962 domain-containing protein, partial [Hadesarchaea archaeon]|nr:DUF4962 domain-containing protein [Hadesarchaea archaeon]
SYVLEEALGGGTWYWRVRAVDGAGNESWSETFHFTVDGGEERPGIERMAIIMAAACAALVVLAVSRRLRRVGPKVRR